MSTKRLTLLLLTLLVWLTGSAIADTRLGLHVTQEELNCWRQRAGLVTPGSLSPSCGTSASGGVGAAARYRTAGDVQTNSPGDWTRVLANANAFRSSPTTYSYLGTTHPGSCVANNENPVDSNGHSAAQNTVLAEPLRDAAFVYLMTGDTSYGTPVRTILLQQAAAAGLQFPGIDSPPWCMSPVSDIPTMLIAPWFHNNLYAYDYLMAGAAAGHTAILSSGDKATLDAWFLDSAQYFFEPFVNKIQTELNLFTTRDNLTTWTVNGNPGNLGCSNEPTFPIYFGGPNIPHLVCQLQNRKATVTKYFGSVGTLLNHSATQSGSAGTARLNLRARRFFGEWLRYAIFADGTPGEFERWHDGVSTQNEPTQGYAYSFVTVACMAILADQWARDGDLYGYNLSTSEGINGTAGGAKTLALVLTNMASYVNHHIVRYGTDNAGFVDAAHIIDTVNQQARNTDIYLALGNRFYQDTFVKNIYRRAQAGENGYTTPQYPSNPDQGGSCPWCGPIGGFPGLLLMYGQMEGVADPYNLTGGDTTPPAAPTNLRVIP